MGDRRRDRPVAAAAFAAACADDLRGTCAQVFDTVEARFATARRRPALVDAYGAHDAAGLFAAVRTDGLAALGQELRAIERADAACVRFARFKASDDATALWVRVAG